MDGISLAAAIAELRKQITLAMNQAQDEGLKFRLGPVELELQVQLERSSEAEAGVKAWVVSVGGGGKLSRADTHRVTLSLQPMSASGGDVEVKRKKEERRHRIPMEE